MIDKVDLLLTIQRTFYKLSVAFKDAAKDLDVIPGATTKEVDVHHTEKKYHYTNDEIPAVKSKGPYFPKFPKGWEDMHVKPDFIFPKDWIEISDIMDLHDLIRTIPSSLPCIYFLMQSMLTAFNFVEVQSVVNAQYGGKDSVGKFLEHLTIYFPELKDLYYFFEDDHGLYVVSRDIFNEAHDRVYGIESDDY